MPNRVFYSPISDCFGAYLLDRRHQQCADSMILRLITVHENASQPSPRWGRGLARDGAFTSRHGTGEGVPKTRAFSIFIAAKNLALPA